MDNSKYLNDNELLALSKSKILVEGPQGLIKIDREVALAEGVKLRIGSIVSGTSILGPDCDIGLAGGAVIENSQLGENSVITSGGKIFYSVSGPNLRNYGSHIRNSKIGSNFVIRSMAETKDLVAGDHCKMKMFSRAYHSEIGDKNVIGSHSIISHCSLGNKNTIKDYCTLEHCQIGDKTKIGSYVHVKGDKGKKSILIEDDCILGDNVVIHPGTKLHANSKVPDYSLVFTRNGKTVMSVIDMNEAFKNN